MNLKKAITPHGMEITLKGMSLFRQPISEQAITKLIILHYRP